MVESEHPPPHAGERLTREDVLRLIEEHGGPERLDLEQADLREADLSELDLHGAYLVEANLRDANLRRAALSGAKLGRAALSGAKLQGANLQHANLQGAKLVDANLQGANLIGANLQDANLWEANLQDAYLRAADLRRADLTYANLRDATLEDISWADYVLAEEIAGSFARAASTYRALKQRHTEAGMYDIAGEFHYREMEARRKLAREYGPPLYALTMNALRSLYGYGERPERVIAWAAAVVFGLALLVHWPLGTVSGGFWDALYYSAVSFTALGYGASDSDPQGWAGRFLGPAESLMGVFMMALFLVTFTRKMTR